MAQTGYTPILIYSSSTTTNVPLAANLTNSTLGSELAINITDGKLFYKDNANVIQVIGWKTVPTTAGGTGLTSYTAGDLVYYASGTTFTKLGIGAANTVLTSSGTAPQWSTNLNIGSLTATSISDSGNLTFTGTGNRITGDFSNATVANRVMFQTSTTNGNTVVSALPNGTAVVSGFRAYNNSDLSNNANIIISIDGALASIQSQAVGTGTALPMAFFTGGSEAMRIFTSRGVSIGNTTDPGATNLSVTGKVTAKLHDTETNVFGSVANGGTRDVTLPSAGQYLFVANQDGQTNGAFNTIAFVNAGSSTIVVTPLYAFGINLSTPSGLIVRITNSAGGVIDLHYSYIRIG